MSSNKQKILNLISKCKLCVVTTVNGECNPQSALMGFGQTEDFEIILGTSTQSRKFENIKNNNKVSIVFGWDSTVTVQYEGKIKEIIGKEAEKYKKIYFAKTPAAQKYDNDPNQTYLLVKPDWARYTDISEMNPQIFELDISKL